MRKERVRGLLAGVLGALAVGLIACSSQESTGSAQQVAQQQSIPATESATPVAVIEDEIAEELAATETDECLECHTDKDRLIQTADPVGEVESENSGEG